MKFSRALRIVLSCIALATAGMGMAQQSMPQAVSDELHAAQAAAKAALQEGPRDIPLRDQAVLKLPAGYAFIPQAEGARYMKAIGNHPSDTFVGLVVGDRLNGFVTVDYEKSGYIKDDDAKHWNADELIDNLRKGTEEGNKDRAARGFPQLDIVGWVEKPNYDSGTHRLIWSISSREKGAPLQSEQGINYNTYLLGREGYLTLDLVTDLATVEAEKPLARELLAAVSFNSGKRYEDFNASTDHVAEYGLAALVGGLAVKKLGLLAVIGAFLLKAWKLVAVAAVAVIAGAKKIFSKDKQES